MMHDLTIRTARDIAIIADVRRRDLTSARDWTVAIVVTALVLGLALIIGG